MPTLILALGGFLCALAVTAACTPAVRRLASRQTWTDRPDGMRKLHAVATPSAGGLAIFAGVAVGLGVLATAAAWIGLPSFALHPAVYLGALAMVAVGAYDDIRGLGFKPKLLVECLVAYLLIHSGFRVDLSAFVGGDPYAEALYSIPLTMLWIVGVINAVNLIDGVDGLAAGIAAIAFASLAAVFGLAGDLPAVLVAVAVVGALVGFLFYNFNPASIFMGDSGSLFLGYALAIYSLSGDSLADPRLAPLVPVIVLGLPLLDTALSMVRRLAERRAIFAPDADHIHHRMVGRFSTRHAVLALYGVAAFFGAAAVLVSVSSAGLGLAVAVATFGAAVGLVSLLGYVRRPYVQPQMRFIGGPTAIEGAAATAEMEDAARDQERAPHEPLSGDGAQTPVPTDPSSGRVWGGGATSYPSRN